MALSTGWSSPAAAARIAPTHAAGIACAALILSACGGAPGPGGGEVAIAEIAGRPVLLAEFQRILDEAPEDASDVIKSRLLDQFLDEQVLLEEARRRGIRAADAEVERSAGRLLASDSADDAFREELRATLTVELLLRQILEETADVTPQEAEAYYQDNPDEFHRPAIYRVRQILVDDAERARELREAVQAEPGRFEEIAAASSLSPDGGRQLSYSEDAFPQEIAAVVKGLSAGKLSPVIELSNNYIFFRVEEVLPKRSLSYEEVAPEIRVRLLERRGSGAMSELLADLKSRLGVRLHTDNLPFRYVREEPA